MKPTYIFTPVADRLDTAEEYTGQAAYHGATLDPLALSTYLAGPHNHRPSFNVFVDGIPRPQGSMKNIGKGRLIHPQQLTQWRNHVAHTATSAALAAGFPLNYDAPVTITTRFYLPQPTRPRFNHPATKPDLDKLTRAIGDALSLPNPAVLKDDSRILEWITSKEYNPRPGASITITALPTTTQTPTLHTTITRQGETN
ncbi:RusA family crossover junction endodeoxyribonuclease [Actinobaculum massiliense]|uniref:RusA family crossover junction endodeoxyribonuclease n=1 Tax=Actinobaculum massiliense TaxID=202789 RepID=UPI00071AF1EB|nr:RusA family crossover junction endodeoxyribonuclease [Actinobaculum massiliense]